MAQVKQPFAMSFSVEDGNSDSGTTTFYAPATTTEADLAAVADDIYALINPLILGQLTGYQFSSVWKEEAYTLPTAANGNTEDKAVFTFITNKQNRVSLSLPTFDPALTLDETQVPYAEARQIVDITDADVSAFVSGMVTGFTDGTVTIVPSGRRTEMGDIIALISANYVQGDSPGRSRKRG
jgi:hypothetical protein